MNTSINVALSTFGTVCFVAAGACINGGKFLEGVAVGCLGLLAFVVYEKLPSSPTA